MRSESVISKPDERADIRTSTMQTTGTGLKAIAIACGRTAPTTGHNLITLPGRADAVAKPPLRS